MKRFHSIFVCTGLGLLSLTPGVAHADRETGLDTRSTWAPIAVIQSTPGVHITLSGGKLGIGASLDLLAGGALNGNRDFSIGPGIVGGGFAEVNAVRKEGCARVDGRKTIVY